MSDQLRTIGLIGGMSWQSSAVYYRQLNELVQASRGGHASAPVVLWSVDFGEIEALQRAGDWDAQGRLLADVARRLQASGVAAVGLATNTLHLVADQITAGLTVPFVDLIEVTARAAAERGFDTVGLLATEYTMTSDMYPIRLAEQVIHTVVPDGRDRFEVQRIIYDELVHGIVDERSRASLLRIVRRLQAQGAQAVILGCTELAMSLTDGVGPVPFLDTTTLHCQALADVILNRRTEFKR